MCLSHFFIIVNDAYVKILSSSLRFIIGNNSLISADVAVKQYTNKQRFMIIFRLDS